jgi:hypothetical protein
VESINKLLAILRKFNNGTCAVGKQLGLWLIAIMTLIILIQVFFRYVLNAAPSWSEEVARSMMVWMTFAVAPIAYRTGGNVALDTLYFMLKGRLRTLMALLINVMIVCFTNPWNSSNGAPSSRRPRCRSRWFMSTRSCRSASSPCSRSVSSCCSSACVS